MKKISTKCGIIATVMFFLMSGSVAAAVRISPLPEPQPTAKLRIFVVVVTTEYKSANRPISWRVSPEAFEQWNMKLINKKLRQLGFYEVVSASDIQAVLGDQSLSAREWTAGEWKLARDAGKALHADYVLIFERSQRLHLQFDAKLINLNTGKQFEASGYVPSAMMRHMTKDQKMQAAGEVVKIHYRKIFQEAKSDLLQTAILKGRLRAEQSTPPPPAPATTKLQSLPDGSEKQGVLMPPKEKPVQGLSAPLPVKAKAFSPEEGKNNQLKFEKELGSALSSKDKKTDSPRLVVYDFDAAERLKVVGLILTEALREELYNLGGFVLVNRENILKIMDEYKLQQTSLIDEKQAVQVGKWLAANEAVTGNLAILGNTSILQVKRVDIKTLGTMALGSLKCPAGREDELLDKMPELARKLVPAAKQ